MSNVVPQTRTLNGDEWLELEDAHRSVVANPASGIEVIWVVAGPVMGDRTETIGNGVRVPAATFKLLAWYDDRGRLSMRAYVMPQDAEGPLESFLTSVDDVEQQTGLDFFPELPDDLERPLEAQTAISLW
jgi:endonuclease G